MYFGPFLPVALLETSQAEDLLNKLPLSAQFRWVVRSGPVLAYSCRPFSELFSANRGVWRQTRGVKDLFDQGGKQKET